METAQSKMDKLILAKGKVMGKVTVQGVEAVFEEFVIMYQGAVEADTENSFTDVLAKSCKDVNEHLAVLRAYHLINTMK